MPSPLPPEEEFCCDKITAVEIQAAVKRMKSSSSPSPFDRMTHLIFKRCPSLSKALCDLFNSCWTLSAVPSQWKVAAITLLGKSSAEDDPTTPGNFRPIALTPCIGKLFKHSTQSMALLLDQQYLPRPFHSEGIHANHPRLCRASSETGSHPCRSQEEA